MWHSTGSEVGLRRRRTHKGVQVQSAKGSVLVTTEIADTPSMCELTKRSNVLAERSPGGVLRPRFSKRESREVIPVEGGEPVCPGGV